MESLSSTALTIQNDVMAIGAYLLEEQSKLDRRFATTANIITSGEKESRLGEKESTTGGLNKTVSGHNILTLNIGGTRYDVRRECLCGTDSLLSFLSTGRWDEYLLRDKRGVIYLGE